MAEHTEQGKAHGVGKVLLLAVAAVAFGFLMAWLLAPGGAGYRFKVPDANAYFLPSELERMHHYQREVRLIGLGGLLLTFLVLGTLAIWRGGPMALILDRLGRRPVLGAGALGALVSILLSVLMLPLGWLAFGIGRDHGLLTQDGFGWLEDQALSALIAALFAGLGAIIVILLWRRFKGYFWLPASAIVGFYALLTVWLWPVLISPLFNHFTPLPEGPVRSRVLSLAEQEGINVGGVYSVDASRRSTALNAYVNGLGSTKRVVIYDNSIKDLNRSELAALIAHELGHVKSHDVFRGLAFALLVIPLGALFVQLATLSLARRRGDDVEGPGVIPALALFAILAALLLGVPGNVLSRNIEAHADRLALETTENPDGMIDLQIALANADLDDPDPPDIYQYLFGTHPTTMRRIGAARAWPGRKAYP